MWGHFWTVNRLVTASFCSHVECHGTGLTSKICIKRVPGWRTVGCISCHCFLSKINLLFHAFLLWQLGNKKDMYIATTKTSIFSDTFLPNPPNKDGKTSCRITALIFKPSLCDWIISFIVIRHCTLHVCYRDCHPLVDHLWLALYIRVDTYMADLSFWKYELSNLASYPSEGRLLKWPVRNTYMMLW